jgi:hypothetical protein
MDDIMRIQLKFSGCHFLLVCYCEGAFDGFCPAVRVVSAYWNFRFWMSENLQSSEAGEIFLYWLTVIKLGHWLTKKGRRTRGRGRS